MVSPDELLIPLPTLVKRIHAINHGWKLAQRLFSTTSPLAERLRQAKTDLQLYLLAVYRDRVRLEPDPAEAEAAYSLCLIEPVAGHRDAAHIPKGLVKPYLGEAQ